MFYDLKDKKPKNSGENWVAPNATIIGDVTLEKKYKHLVQCCFKRRYRKYSCR